MTEQEAIKDIQRQLLEINSEDADITLSTEALNVAIKALEKQIAKKPNYVQYDANPKIGNWHCPNCNSIVFKTVNRIGCIDCLQKLDWE